MSSGINGQLNCRAGFLTLKVQCVRFLWLHLQSLAENGCMFSTVYIHLKNKNCVIMNYVMDSR